MEFSFDISNVTKNEIVRIGNTLIPEGFRGDNRQLREVIQHVTEILDEMGRASAAAQDLHLAITSGTKMRNSEHIIYLLVEHKSGSKPKGTVVGLLKMGQKRLFVFDHSGCQHEVQPLCVLDFYVHESKQRVGCGRKLFEYMLKKEEVEPQHLAIDRPSDKFLAFLYKHYGLKNIMPQMNNYVVYDGFFTDRPDGEPHDHGLNLPVARNGQQTPSRSNFVEPASRKSSSGSALPDGTKEVLKPPTVEPLLFNRFSAPRPHSSMGQILQNSPFAPSQTGESQHLPSSVEMPNVVEYNPSNPSNSDFIHPKVTNGTCNAEIHEEINHCVASEFCVEGAITKDGSDVNSNIATSCRQVASEEFYGHGSEQTSGKMDLKYHHHPLW